VHQSLTAIADRITRPLVTLMLVGVFCYGFLTDKIAPDTFGAVVISVTSFWFGQRSGEARAHDRAAGEAAAPGATATAPPGGGTATATVTPSPH
jgi:hypothetical protein